MKSSDPILLVLDLDETLIHATATPPLWTPDLEYDRYMIKKRPHLEDFLRLVSQDYALAIWSSASDQYVSEIVAKVIPEEIQLEFVWGRSRCTLSRDLDVDTYVYAKKLKKIKKMNRFDFSLERMLIVDDTKAKVRSNYGNAIYIRPFTGNQDDTELIHLGRYLNEIKDTANVRTLEKRGWRDRI